MSPFRAVLAVVVLALAGLVGVAYLAYQEDMRRAHERVSTGSRIAQTPCGPIEYAVAGDGPPVLAVHGAGGGFDQGLALTDKLSASGFRVIAPSRFGYLRTPLPADASASAQADAHACLLDALGLGRVAVFGASAGAPSAMQFALRHPQRTAALVLLVPAAYVPRPDNAPPMRTPAGLEALFDTALRWDFLFWAGIRYARGTMIRAILGTPPAVMAQASAEDQAGVARMLNHILPVSARRLGLLNDSVVTASLPRYALERIAAPTLAISAEDDLYGTFDGARYTAEHVPRARFIRYPSGGHLLVGREQETMSAIIAFLRRPGARDTPSRQ